jgi:hypothetical protein
VSCWAAWYGNQYMHVTAGRQQICRCRVLQPTLATERELLGPQLMMASDRGALAGPGIHIQCVDRLQQAAGIGVQAGGIDMCVHV